MKSEFLVVSDLHLERKNVTAQNFILNTINELIQKRQKKGLKTILVCPGDVHNGTKGVDFLSKIQAPVVYVAGNHEFWEQDYYETLTAFHHQTPSNVHFLHNDFVVLEDFIFVGATLWSDLGKELNPDIFTHAAFTMNDTHQIKAAQWYEQQENIEKSYSLSHFSPEKIAENKAWNIFIEREENEKSLTFYKEFFEMYRIIKAIPEALETLDSRLNSSYKPLTPEEYHRQKAALLAYEQDDSFEHWFEQNKHLLGYREYDIPLDLTPVKEKIFTRLKGVNLKDKKIIMVSHHLPFLEERLIGRQEWFEEDINKKYFKTLPATVYGLRQGVDYNYHNYMWRLSKGEFNKDEAITQVVHYHNDGSTNLPHEVIKHTYAWVHGHEHSYNYEDTLKGIKIITNPLAHSMAVFSLNQDGTIGLGETYKRYHQVADNEEKKIIEKLKKSFLRVPNLTLSKTEQAKAVALWALKSFNWDEYTESYDYIYQINEKLFSLLLKNPQWTESMNKPTQMKVFVLIDALAQAIQSVQEMENRFNEGIDIRIDENYSFNLKYGHSYQPTNHTSYFKYVSEPLRVLKHQSTYKGEFDYEFWLRESYENKCIMEKNQPKITFVKEALEKFPIVRVSQVTPTALKAFDKVFPRHYHSDFDFTHQMQSNFYKLREEHQKDFLEEQRKRRSKLLDF